MEPIFFKMVRYLNYPSFQPLLLIIRLAWATILLFLFGEAQILKRL